MREAFLISIQTSERITGPLSELVGRVQAHHERVTVTVHGKPSAVLLAPDDLERMEETIAVLADSSLMKQLIDSESDLAAGRTESLQDVRETMRARGWSG